MGYLSEACASLIDRQLMLGLVPRTEVVKLSSGSFHYSRKDLYLAKKSNNPVPLPLKVGSFQLFMEGFENASAFFARSPWPSPCSLEEGYTCVKMDDDTSPMLANDHHSQMTIWTPARQHLFRLELEKLVILDYLIRNTDRGSDNWMIKISGDKSISVAAIDHGLAFPHKHPDNWRSYPYGWLQLPHSLLDRPFSTSIRSHILPLLTSSAWWQNTEHLLIKLNQLDPDFNQNVFSKQMEVMRGQAWNLVECLKRQDEGPLQLCKRTPVVVMEQEQDDNESMGAEMGPIHSRENDDWPDPFLTHNVSKETSTRKRVIRKLKILSSRPWFASC